MQCPANDGFLYYNYENLHSIFLMTVVGPNFNFNMVGIGDFGKLSYGSVFADTNIGR